MSAAATLSEQFAEHVAAEREGLAETYREAVRAAVDGTPPAYEDLMLLCQVAERTPDDFVRDVEALERRREMASKLEDVTALYAEVPTIQEEIATEKQRLKEQEERVEAAVKKLSSVRSRIRRTENLKTQLIKSCNDPERLEKYQQQKAVVQRLGAQHKNAHDHLQSLNYEARHLKYELDQGRGRNDQRLAWRARLDEAMGEITNADETVHDLQQQIDQAIAELRTCELALAEV